MAKTPPDFAPISTSEIVRWIRAPEVAPLRVDFAGGWLDVPRFARKGGYIVNCAISPTVSLREWPYHQNAGLGGSGAWALINGKDGVSSELDLGVGWQDPAVINETGLCVWRSGQRPELEMKTDGGLLRGRLALYWSGKQHSTPGVVNQTPRLRCDRARGPGGARRGVGREFRRPGGRGAAVRTSCNGRSRWTRCPVIRQRRMRRSQRAGRWRGNIVVEGLVAMRCISSRIRRDGMRRVRCRSFGRLSRM